MAGKVAPVTQIRSTLITSSIQTLRSKGLLEDYLRILPKDLHSTVLDAVAGSWMPAEIGMAHYGAADALGLTALEQFEIGREVSKRTQNTVLGVLARTARHVGAVTPWKGLEHFQKMWDRLLVGGSGAVYRIGPKEAHVEAHGNPMVRWPYYRNGWRGMFTCAGELFCEKIYVTEITPPSRVGRELFVMRIMWV